jgi:hypothetical protein
MFWMRRNLHQQRGTVRPSVTSSLLPPPPCSMSEMCATAATACGKCHECKKRHVTETYGTVEVRLHVFVTWAADEVQPSTCSGLHTRRDGPPVSTWHCRACVGNRTTVVRPTGLSCAILRSEKQMSHTTTPAPTHGLANRRSITGTDIFSLMYRGHPASCPLRTVPRSQTGTAMPPLPYTSSWRDTTGNSTFTLSQQALGSTSGCLIRNTHFTSECRSTVSTVPLQHTICGLFLVQHSSTRSVATSHSFVRNKHTFSFDRKTSEQASIKRTAK